MENMPRVYLDVCVLNRLFDDQRQMRIRLETDAILLILKFVQEGTLQLVFSRVHLLEIVANPTENRREHIENLVLRYGITPDVQVNEVRSRTEWLIQRGLGVADAAHVAFAEAMQAGFVSVDDRLLKQCQRVKISTWCGNPIAYCDKEKLGV